MYPLKDTATYLTNKKLLLTLAVVAGAVFLITIGVWISNKITDGAEQNARMYQTALQITDENQLNYSIDTKQRYVLAPITIKPVDTVKFPEMNKEFSAVNKTEETYTRHSREVCTTDANDNTHCHTEYYYQWDNTNEWSVEATKVKMADREYPISLFGLRYKSINASDIINGEKGQYVYVESQGIFGFDVDIFNEADRGDKRYSYDVLQLPQSGTAFLKLSDSVQAAKGGRIDLDDRNAKEIVKSAQNDVKTQNTVFGIFWGILVLAELLGFGYWVWIYEEY